MDIMELGAIGELVGGVAVVASLVYIGVQIRQNTAATRAGTALEASRLYSDFHATVNQTPDLAGIYGRGTADFSALNEDERARFLWLTSHSLYIIEGLFRQFELGFLERETWEPFEQLASGVIGTEAGALWWNASMSLHSKRFRKHIESVARQRVGHAWRPDSELVGR